MPELPEVETVRRQLTAHVVGRRVKNVAVRFAGRLNVSAVRLDEALHGRTLKSVDRRVKLLILNFSGGQSLLVHLKMTGAFRIVPTGTTPEKHAHVIFELAGPQDLHFRDLRKFGYMKLVPTKDIERVLAEQDYGPEPLGCGFGAVLFADCLRRRSGGTVKQVLLDQSCLAGVGNIYADESLFKAGIRPDRRVASLSAEDLDRLHGAVVGIMRSAVRHRGTSADDFLDIFGRPGSHQDYLQVYGRAGEPCPNCGRPITKVRLGGRGTHFCADCQK